MITLRAWHRPAAFMQLATGAALLAMAFPGLGLAFTAPPSLGTADAFSVLAGQTVTNTGPTTMNGNLGVSPGSAITGFPPGQVLSPSTTHVADSVAGQAQSDTTTAYNALAGAACNSNKTGVDLGGQTLTTGVYCFTSEAQLTGTLVLDGQGDADAVFIFQIVSKLTTASNASVRLINGASPCNVFWQVGSSATVGTTTTFVGNILALTSIALQTGASVNGRALARNGAVTMDTNQIRSDSCVTTGGTTGVTGGVTGVTGGTTGGTGATPELDSLVLFGAGALGLAGYARTRFIARRRRGDG